MAFLRLGSTRRVVGLLLGVAALLIAIAVGASAAFGGGGEAPPAKSLPRAIRAALGAPKVSGVTARVQFTSDLFSGMTTDQSSALMKGGSGRLWAAPGKLRLELQSDNGDAQIVYANGKGFVYDGPSDTAYTFALPAKSGKAKSDRAGGSADALPTIAQIEKRITKAQRHATIAGPQPEVVGGQPAYQVRITPKDSGGQVGAAELAWDAVRGVPLKVAIYARGSTSPALQLEATDIGYGAVDPSVFALTPPPGATVVDMGGGSGGGTSGSAGSGSQPTTPGFSVNAPATLGSRGRSEVKRTGDGYLVLYGKGLDSVAVFEHKAKPHAATPPSSSSQDGQPLQIPTVKVNGATANAFGTPLGGIVSFDRGGISYVVAGSHPLSVLEAAAGGL